MKNNIEAIHDGNRIGTFDLVKKESNKKFNPKDNIVLLTFDDGYYMQAINLMLSVKKFNDNVSFICICPKLSNTVFDEVLSDEYGLGVKVYVYQSNITWKINRWKDVSCFRLFAPWLIQDESVSEVLYLDADMLCKGSLQPIFDIKDYWIVMCSEVSGNTVTSDSSKSELMIYCNSGLTKINLSRFRQHYSYETIFNEFFGNLNKLSCPDQDFLNYCLGEDKVKRINGCIFNFQPYEFLGSYYYNTIEENCKIIHFSSFRPWDRDCGMKEYFDLYLKYSFYEPIKRVVENEQKRYKQLALVRFIRKTNKTH